jgi:hypothetical protein
MKIKIRNAYFYLGGPLCVAGPLLGQGGGESEMPGFSDIPAHDLDALAAHISNPSASGQVLVGVGGVGMANAASAWVGLLHQSAC